MKTITGTFQKPDGSAVASGKLYLQLSQDATLVGTAQIAPTKLTFPLDTSGTLGAGVSILANDELSPSGTAYTLTVRDVNDLLAYGPEIVSITGGSPINLNSALVSSTGVTYPTAVITAPTGSQTIAGDFALNVGGSLTAKRIAGIRVADQFTGADCGAKINAAFTDLAGPGEVWVNQSCGTTWTTAVTIGTGQVVRFIQGGTYNLSAAITMSGNSPSLVGTPHGGQSTISFTNGGTILKESNSINLANLIIGSGDDLLISDINLDGNKSNNTTTVGVSLTGQRPSIRYSNITSFPSHGISYTNSNDWMDLNHVMVYLNGGHGLSCSSAADLKVSQSQFQTNSLNGIDLNNCSGSSFSFNEVSGNLNDGIKVYGTAAAGSNFLTYANNLMGQNAQHDIEIVGTDGSGGCLGAYDVQIIGNRINGGGPKAADNTYDILKITDGCHIIVDGNQFFSSPATNRNKYAIENVETGASRAHDIIIGGSNKFSGTFGTAVYSSTTVNASTWALPALANMAYVDSTNTITSVQQLSAGVVYNFGASSQQINFQPASGTNTLVLTSSTVDGYKPHRLVEQAAPSGSAGNDLFWGDSTAHRLKMNNNNGGADTVVGAATTDTLSNKTFSDSVPLQSANAAQWVRGQATELLTLSTVGATTDTAANLLPASSIIEAVVARVTTTITTATDWKLGDATQAARFTAAQSGGQLTAGATVVGLNQADPTVATANLGPVQSAAAKVRVTTTGTPGAGAIRITVFYRQFVAPTS